ncbi:MAG: peptide ABC transporter substrate-binding protein [Proteobacteria bacterium]|nr:peptide ABC transporter substrate-binding protein [Pseudomonadota bacterium]
MRPMTLLSGLVTALACATLLASGPAVAQKMGGTLKVYHRDNPPTASIHEEATISTVIPFMSVFNNLVVYDQHVPQNSDKSIRPDLAKSWTWNAEKTAVTFKLEEGVKWHDGRPFTSRDVVCTFDLLTDRSGQKLRTNPRASWYRNLDHVSADGEYDVTIHLRRPQASLMAMLASGMTPIYPCHVSMAQMRTRPIGTGPFKLQSFSEFQNIRLVRNPDYWKKGRPYLDAIDFTIVNNPSTAALSFVAGRFDLTFPWELTAADLKFVKKEASAAVCETTSMNLNVNLLVNRTVAPFDNADMRRALILALDRKAFVDTLTQGQSVVGGTMQPPPDGVWGLPADMLAVVPGYGPDVEKNRTEARAIMAKAGYGPNKPLRLKIATRGVAIYKDAAGLIQGQLKQIYIDASVDVVETSLWFNRLRRKDYVLGVNATGNGIDDPDQTFYENFACKSARNYTGYCNPEIEKMFETQSTESDPAKRLGIVREIDVRLLADGARPPIYWSRSSTCHQPYVKGYTSMVNSIYNGFRFEDVWLDK